MLRQFCWLACFCVAVVLVQACYPRCYKYKRLLNPELVTYDTMANLTPYEMKSLGLKKKEKKTFKPKQEERDTVSLADFEGEQLVKKDSVSADSTSQTAEASNPMIYPYMFCQVRMNHIHDGMRFRGVPWWKRKNLRTGQAYRRPEPNPTYKKNKPTYRKSRRYSDPYKNKTPK